MVVVHIQEDKQMNINLMNILLSLKIHSVVSIMLGGVAFVLKICKEHVVMHCSRCLNLLLGVSMEKLMG